MEEKKAKGGGGHLACQFAFSLFSLSLSLSHCLSVRSIAEMADNGGEAALPKKILKKQASDGGYIKVALQARLEAKRGKRRRQRLSPCRLPHTHTHTHTHAHTHTRTHVSAAVAACPLLLVCGHHCRCGAVERRGEWERAF